MTVLDLFAGAGGFSEAFRRTDGYEVVAAVEHDADAAATFRANHGGIIAATSIEDWLAKSHVPEVDVVVGGPPCQGFSTLGRQDPDDVRNRLWSEYVEAVRRARPHYFVLENVGAFAKAPQYYDLAREVAPAGRLSEYDFIVDVLNAADYGTPQKRSRTIFIGYRRDLPEPSMPRPTHAGAHVSVSDAFAARAVKQQVRHRPLGCVCETPDECVCGLSALHRNRGPYLSTDLHADRTYTDLSLRRFAVIPYGGNRFQLPEHLKTECWKKHTTGSGDVMGRLRWEEPSVTIRTEFTKPEKGRYLHPVENRAITIYEGAVLQGFPDDYRWIGSRTSIAQQIGNAVPIQLGRAIAERILEEAQEAGVVPTPARQSPESVTLRALLSA